MSLSGNVDALAARLAQEFVAVRSEIGGGSVLGGYTSVKDHAATGDGVTDDTAELQAALDATVPGGVCFVPPGVYRVSAPLVVPPNITLLGAHNDTLTYAEALPNPCTIRPLPGFTGRAVLRVVDKTTGGYSAAAVGTRIQHLTVDGSGTATAGVVGVELYGFVREFTADHLTVRNCPGDGISTTGHSTYSGDSRSPQSLRFQHCVSDNNGGAGFVGSGTPDCTWFDCNAQGNDYVGFYIAGAQNGMLVACRAEWSGQHNYLITGGNWGTGQGSGGLMMIGCLTDRAGYNGVYIDSTGSAAHSITGMVCRRDGRNNGLGGGGYAALNVNGATTPVVVDNLTVYPGVDDDGLGTNSPQYAVSAAGSVHVVIDSGYLHAATTAVFSGAGNGLFSVSPGVGIATGTTVAPVRVSNRTTMVLTAGNATIAAPAAGFDGQTSRYTVFAQGQARTASFAAGIRTSTGLNRGPYSIATNEVLFAVIEYSTLIGAWVLTAVTVSVV